MTMKQDLIKDVIQGMLSYLNNAQCEKLQEVLQYTLARYEVMETEQQESHSEQNYVELFLSAKRIEGCSEKSLKYYKATIEMMIVTVGKNIKHIETEDIRRYLTEYQKNKKSSKVTIDNIRRILSSFFSWLEEEDYILKSPMRRIHKIKTKQPVKEIISDFDNFEDVEKFMKERREVYDAICALDDNESVVTCQGSLYEEIKIHSMGYYFDTHSYAIGLIDRNDED